MILWWLSAHFSTFFSHSKRSRRNSSNITSGLIWRQKRERIESNMCHPFTLMKIAHLSWVHHSWYFTKPLWAFSLRYAPCLAKDGNVARSSSTYSDWLVKQRAKRRSISTLGPWCAHKAYSMPTIKSYLSDATMICWGCKGMPTRSMSTTPERVQTQTQKTNLSH